MSEPRERQENIPQIIMLLPQAWTVPTMVAGCLLSEVSRRICQCSSVRWSIKRDSSENATCRHSAVIQACKLQLSLSMNSSQHRCMNQASASEAQTQQRSLNSSLGGTVGSSLVISCSTVARLFARTHLRSHRSPLSSTACGAPYLPSR
ncbi:hypothetical protein TNCV_1695491 [Trichonephila clavipes]|nr:hypothetical protein TNCV_1695491 [Trichonephila clavipes]